MRILFSFIDQDFMKTVTPVISLHNITKRFGKTVANDGVNFDLMPSEIHALLGENGAGKTTLMNILYGLIRPDEGDIYIRGEKVQISDPQAAIDHKIGMVHQHFMLIQPFTLLQNIMLGSEFTRFGFCNKKKAMMTINALSKRYKLPIDPNQITYTASVSVQQRVELLHLLFQGADIFIFDEPTAVLPPQEIDEFIATIKTLANQGKSIILITHKLREIQMVADRCTVIRRGKIIGTVNAETATKSDLVSMMVGKTMAFDPIPRRGKKGSPAVRIMDLYARDSRKLPALQGISLDVHAHEIVALAGVDGNGQRECVEVLAGVRSIEKGQIWIEGKTLTEVSPRVMFQLGGSNVPEDRHKDGLVLPYSVANNLVLRTYQKYTKRWSMNFEDVRCNAERLIEDYSIFPPSPDHLCEELSGGNQQKVVIARELSSSPHFLVASHPTRGLDVGAADYVHRALVRERDRGVGVLLVSFDLDEIFRIADKIAVIYEGRIIGVKEASETSLEEIGALLAGYTQ